MSDYKYETEIGRLDIKTSHSPKLVFVWVHEDTQQAAIHIPNDDVPRVALELLKAAGYGDQNNPLAANDAIADLNGIITELEVIANTKAA